jgi:prepilin-type N-terminal cleavage/methylation domain-containing protein
MRLVGGFTLIEILSVMVIMLVLMGLIIGAFQYGTRKAMEARIRTEILALENALESYKAKYGGYPPLDPAVMSGDATVGEGFPATSFGAGSPYVKTGSTGAQEWLNSQYIFRALGTNNPDGPMYHFSDKQTMTFSKIACSNAPGYPAKQKVTIIVDPMGQPYGYDPASPVMNPTSFDLWSVGSTMVHSSRTSSKGETMIGNWDPRTQ